MTVDGKRCFEILTADCDIHRTFYEGVTEEFVDDLTFKAANGILFLETDDQVFISIPQIVSVKEVDI